MLLFVPFTEWITCHCLLPFLCPAIGDHESISFNCQYVYCLLSGNGFYISVGGKWLSQTSSLSLFYIPDVQTWFLFQNKSTISIVFYLIILIKIAKNTSFVFFLEIKICAEGQEKLWTKWINAASLRSVPCFQPRWPSLTSSSAWS